MLKTKLKKIVLAALFASGALHAATNDTDFIQTTVNQFMQTNHVPGLAVTVYTQGKPAAYYFGYANLAKKTPVTAKTIFEVGSITKLMTSLLLAQEVDKAKVQLNDAITKYQKDLPGTLNQITFLNLATHTSGLPFELTDKIATQTAFNNYFKDWKPSLSPNETWMYSNVGIELLGNTLVNMTHKNSQQLFSTQLFKPLHMKTTIIGATVPKKLRVDLAQGYDANTQPTNTTFNPLFTTAGGMRSSSQDLQQFLAAAIGLTNTPNIFYPMRMTQTEYVQLNQNEFQGLGWQIHSLNENTMPQLLTHYAFNISKRPVEEISDKPIYDGNALIEKTGATDGFRAYIAVIPNKKSGILIMMNKYTDNQDIIKIGREILLHMNASNDQSAHQTETSA